MAKKKELNKKIRMRYSLVALFFFLLGIAIIAKSSSTLFIHGSEWRQIAEKQGGKIVPIIPKRGNIYSTDRELMATTEERYRLYLDFFGHHVLDSLTSSKVDLIAKELSEILPDSAVRYFKSRINSGLKLRKDYENKKNPQLKKPSGSRKYRILNVDVNYIQLKQIKQIPYFKAGQYKSGLIADPITARINPYGSLALRTVGSVYGNTEVDGKIGKNGLEFYYDSLLRGTPGEALAQRINGQEVRIAERDPIEGKDIVTTIDIDIQELAEKSLLNQLKNLNAESGTAIVMETKTGYIKAIANMGNRGGAWGEHQNYGLSYMIEPGSTFKVVSMMIGLDDGVIQPHDPVDVGNGVYRGFGPAIIDHNAHRGGYGLIDAALSIRYSSNIGVAKLIYEQYKDNPQKYLDGIDRIGAFKDMELEIPGYGVPRIRSPKNPGWSKLSLPWMSYGYENVIPPIYTLSFFNAIANNGELVKPLFVKEIMSNDKVVEKRKKETLNPQICSPETLREIRQMLDDVVNGEKGTGSPVRSKYFSIAGKTGTAQIRGTGGVIEGHQVSFCGFFPVDNPQYSCIVVIRKPRAGEPSGGRMAGGVFKQIAEGMYSRNFLASSDILPIDSIHGHEAIIKTSLQDVQFGEIVPNVKGMGARDAVYAMEKLGLKVEIRGRGSVKTQSIIANSKIRKGETIILYLE